MAKKKPPQKGNAQKPKENKEGANQKFSASITCRYCQRKGHYEANCWFNFPEKRPKSGSKASQGGRNPQNKKPVQEKKVETPQPKFQSEMTQQNHKRQRVNVLNSAKLWTIKAHVNTTPVVAVMDSGATASVVSKRFVNDANLNRETSIPVKVANGKNCFTLGTSEIHLHFGDTK